MITAIITAHRKWHKLINTLESLRHCPNITERLIVATGFNERTVKALRVTAKKYNATLLDQGNAPSHIAWKAGADAVKTPAVILLHDGDVLSPEFSTIAWQTTDNAYVFQARNITDNWVHKELCVEGFRTTQDDIRRVVSAPNSKSLSPGRIVMCAGYLQSALEHFNQEIFTHSLLYGESLAIGNDLTIWAKLGQFVPRITYINKPLIAFDTEDSTTARADAGVSYKLEPYYDRVRARLNLTARVSKLNICYSPYNTPTGVTDFNHLNFPLPAVNMPKNNIYGTAAFMTALEYAWCMGYTWMQFFETDCRFPQGIKAYLESTMKSIDFTQTKIAIGTPTIWNAQGPGREYYKNWNYIKKCYEEQAHISLQVHGDHTAQPALYVNGALGTYNVREVYALLMRDAKRDINSVTPWDLQLGYRIYDKYREDAPSKIGIDPYQYSDGDLIYLPISARTNDNILAWHK